MRLLKRFRLMPHTWYDRIDTSIDLRKVIADNAIRDMIKDLTPWGGDNAMIMVMVSCAKLLRVLQENRAKHAREYTAALEGWREEVKEKMAEMLDSLAVDSLKDPNLSELFKLERPVSYEENYLTLIGMLEMATETEIELNQQQYQQYVEDKWVWKEQWSVSNRHYMKKVRKG